MNQFVVMVLVMLMKPMKHAQKIVMHQANVMQVLSQIVLMTIAVLNLGLVMVLKTVKIKPMAVT